MFLQYFYQQPFISLRQGTGKREDGENKKKKIQALTWQSGRCRRQIFPSWFHWVFRGWPARPLCPRRGFSSEPHGAVAEAHGYWMTECGKGRRERQIWEKWNMFFLLEHHTNYNERAGLVKPSRVENTRLKVQMFLSCLYLIAAVHSVLLNIYKMAKPTGNSS